VLAIPELYLHHLMESRNSISLLVFINLRSHGLYDASNIISGVLGFIKTVREIGGQVGDLEQRLYWVIITLLATSSPAI
jgi:hypothetical protein